MIKRAYAYTIVYSTKWLGFALYFAMGAWAFKKAMDWVVVEDEDMILFTHPILYAGVAAVFHFIAFLATTQIYFDTNRDTNMYGDISNYQILGTQFAIAFGSMAGFLLLIGIVLSFIWAYNFVDGDDVY